MALEEQVRERIEDLISDGDCIVKNGLSHVEGRAWLSSASVMIERLCTDPSNPYRTKLTDMTEWENLDYVIPNVASLLRYLKKDVEAGLVTAIADQVAAETFDDFLDHAAAYYEDARGREAGVIAGVVFEDTVRRICTKNSIVQAGVKLDDLISALAKKGVLTATKAKRARVGAHVRTKATHAQWDEFDLSDVSSTIDIARELILKELDSG